MSHLKRIPIITMILLAVALMSACQSGGEQANTPADPSAAADPQSAAAAPSAEAEVPTVISDSAITVEGMLVPLKHVALSFNMTGVVAEVAVQEGQTVQAGQVLARLDQRPRLQAALAAADLDVLNARQALELLQDTAGVSSAAAQQRLANARDGVEYAERYRNNLLSGSRQTDIDTARANVTLLQDRLQQANEDYASYENKPEDNVTRARYLSSMAEAQRRYDDAVRLLNNLQGTPSEIDMAVADANLALAQAQLALAEKDYQEVQFGPDPDELAAAEAHIASAEAGLAAAQASLADSELTAPFTGTLVRLDLKVGEQALPGVQTVVLADLSGWVVETEDLNEMEIPNVQVGQAALLVPEALPDLELTGNVDSISQYYVEKFGDVTYTAKIVVASTDPRLRWGMTVIVRFERD